VDLFVDFDVIGLEGFGIPSILASRNAQAMM